MTPARAAEPDHHRVLRFPDGSELELRPLETGDGRLVAALANQLSKESEFRRFLATGRAVRSRWVARLVGADQVDLLVDGAVAHNEFGSSLVAVAESIRYQDRPDWAEFALVAADLWQNMGVGTLLARHLSRRAYAGGVRFWEAFMLEENEAMAGVLDSVGPKVEDRAEGPLTIAVHVLTPESPD